MKHLQLEFDYTDLYLKLRSGSKSRLKASSVFQVVPGDLFVVETLFYYEY